MKLFIWHDVFKDYATGMAVCYANSLEEARELVDEKFRIMHHGFAASDDWYDDIHNNEPTIVVDVEIDKTPFFEYVLGG